MLTYSDKTHSPPMFLQNRHIAVTSVSFRDFRIAKSYPLLTINTCKINEASDLFEIFPNAGSFSFGKLTLLEFNVEIIGTLN